MTSEIYHAVVTAHGKVHGVFYRDTMRRSAVARSVAGSAVNLADGTVEMHFEGELSAVEAMIEVARLGSPASKVTELHVEWIAATGTRGFQIG